SMAAFGIPPCKTIGDIKTVIKDAILDGEIHNDRAEDWEVMKREGAKLGLDLKAGFEQPPS
ncbi:MAG: hypothetical protein KDC02_22995, partial [Flavobacteriales bacterium]|nr:hypothetical protein [Flavobacteriales bacterium]